MGQRLDLILNSQATLSTLQSIDSSRPQRTVSKTTPQPQTAPDKERISSSGTLRSCSRNILLVSEDDGQRSLLRAYLQHVGFKVLSCADLDAALRMLAEGRLVQLLLIDSQLLASSARRLSEFVAEHCPDLPVFAISGRSTNDGTLVEVKHRLWEPDSQSFMLPDLLGRIQALTERESEPQVTGSESAAPERSAKVLAFPATKSPRSKRSHSDPY